MKAHVTKVSRFEQMHAWTNRILRIDLTEMRAWAHETAPYVPDYLGARGLAAKIVWDEYPEPVDAFDPRNPLMVFPGALTGARSPYSGRTNVCAFSPQGYPYPWFTRSNIGGHFGGELKRAGYDGIVVTGASEEPVRIRIRDDEVSILPADDLWGQDALDTLEPLEALDGKGTRSLAIGPAGERLSRIATIQTASSSACGQGGFGAVMGSKKLKAISVQGSGQVSLADPERVLEITRAVGVEARSVRQSAARRLSAGTSSWPRREQGSVRRYACTEDCVSPCGLYYESVPGCAYERTWSGHWMCVGSILGGLSEGGPVSYGGVFDWQLGTRGGMEANALCNRYGINQWDLIIGMVPWLEACQNAGLISEIQRAADGLAVARSSGPTSCTPSPIAREWATPWPKAGGGPRRRCTWARTWCGATIPAGAMPVTGTGTARGPTTSSSPSGWSRRCSGPPTPAIRSPAGTAIPGTRCTLAHWGATSSITWDHMRGIAARIYGDPECSRPIQRLQGQGLPGFYHTKRSVIKDCLPADDFRFPVIYSPNTPDDFARVAGIDGPSLEYHLFKAGTGVDWSEGEFERAAERVYTLERALQVRHWGRDRAMDESVLPSFEYLENWVNPLLGERYALDREQFKPVMDEYYQHQGWDVETGWPTRERLAELGLEGVHEPMVEGAQRAKDALPEPPPAEPVPMVDLLAE